MERRPPQALERWNPKPPAGSRVSRGVSIEPERSPVFLLFRLRLRWQLRTELGFGRLVLEAGAHQGFRSEWIDIRFAGVRLGVLHMPSLSVSVVRQAQWHRAWRSQGIRMVGREWRQMRQEEVGRSPACRQLRSDHPPPSWPARSRLVGTGLLEIVSDRSETSATTGSSRLKICQRRVSETRSPTSTCLCTGWCNPQWPTRFERGLEPPTPVQSPRCSLGSSSTHARQKLGESRWVPVPLAPDHPAMVAASPASAISFQFF